MVGDRLYLSWYSDGLRVYDIANPAEPREVAFYRPQPTQDSTGVFTEFGAGTHPIPFVWGAHVTGGLVYLSDINYGLYVVRVGSALIHGCDGFSAAHQTRRCPPSWKDRSFTLIDQFERASLG